MHIIPPKQKTTWAATCVVLLIAVFALLLLGVMANAASGGQQQSPCNLRLQGRWQLDNETIDREQDLQATLFSPLPYDFFLFLNGEAIFSNSNFHSVNGELNISRPFAPEHEQLNSLGWISRLLVESDMESELGLGLQWQIHKTPGISWLTNKLKIKTFLQVFPLKTTDARGAVDLYFYYEFPLPGKFAYTRGFTRQYFHSNTDRDYQMIAQDIIIPIDKSWDLYLRYSHYNDLRNSGVAVGIRYLLQF